jgi:hypothetical protein
MMHFTCDLCGKDLQPGDDPRYVVKIEAYAAHDPAELTEDDLDDDHLEAISQVLSDLEDGGNGPDLPPPSKSFRYDLCPCCHERFLSDPLGREHAFKLLLGNSKN